MKMKSFAKFIQISGGYALDAEGCVWQYRTGVDYDHINGNWVSQPERRGWVELSDVRFPFNGDTK